MSNLFRIPSRQQQDETKESKVEKVGLEVTMKSDSRNANFTLSGIELQRVNPLQKQKMIHRSNKKKKSVKKSENCTTEEITNLPNEG